MANFILKEVAANGAAQILENGNLLQQCVLSTEITGIVLENQILTNVVIFEVPNSEIVGTPQPLTAAWDYIKNVLSPEWVSTNFADII
jgi:hypothetical protein